MRDRVDEAHRAVEVLELEFAPDEARIIRETPLGGDLPHHVPGLSAGEGRDAAFARLAAFLGELGHDGPPLCRRSGARARRKLARDVLLDELLEFLGDPLALQRHGLLAVLVDGCDGAFAGARQADADIRVLALAGTVHDAAHDRDAHVLDALEPAPPLGHAMADVRLDALRELLEIRARRA